MLMITVRVPMGRKGKSEARDPARREVGVHGEHVHARTVQQRPQHIRQNVLAPFLYANRFFQLFHCFLPPERIDSLYNIMAVFILQGAAKNNQYPKNRSKTLPSTALMVRMDMLWKNPRDTAISPGLICQSWII